MTSGLFEDESTGFLFLAEAGISSVVRVSSIHGLVRLHQEVLSVALDDRPYVTNFSSSIPNQGDSPWKILRAAVMMITQDKMDSLSRVIFLPIVLVMNAWVFQYLLSIYYPRRREFRVCMLLLASFLVFAIQLYSHEDVRMLVSMNDISETSLQLTFIIQITIIGRGVSVKVKVRSIVWFTYIGEVFIFVNWLNVVVCMIDAAGMITGDIFHELGNVLESVTLVYVLVFRFYYLSLSLGFRVILSQRKAEFLVYVLLVFHELPFAILQDSTGVSWEFVQAIGNRVLMIACILLNVRVKARGAQSNYTVKKESATQSVKPSRGRGSISAVKAIRDQPSSALPGFAKVAVTSARLSTRADANTEGVSVNEP